MVRNKYAGTCYRCGKHVDVGQGHFERHDRGWRTQHASCAIKYRGTKKLYSVQETAFGGDEEQVNFQELKKQLDSGVIQNLYIFTGEEREVMRKYIKRIGEGTSIMEATAFGEIINKLTFKSLFFKKQTFILPDDNDITEIPFKRVLEIVGENTLILTFKTIDKRKKFFKEAEKYIIEFERFSSGQLVGYIQKSLPELSDPLAMTLAKYCNNEVSRIDLEIDKILKLRYDTDITLELLNDLITPPLEDKIFEMIDAVAKKDKLRAFQLYDDLKELNESPIKIVSLLYTKFRQLYLVQTYFKLPNAELAGKTGMTFYQVNFVRELVGAFSLDRLVKILQLIQSAEVFMKTGQQDIFHAMDVLLVDILS